MLRPELLQFLLAALLAAALPFGCAHAESKTMDWTDVNFVPCEGMGITAIGKVSVTVEFSTAGKVVVVNELHLHTDYQHPHEPAAKLTFTSPDGSPGQINLQKPWFDTIGPDDGSRDLFLPRSGGVGGIAAQTPFRMKADTSVAVQLNNLYPQDGGNCLSSFSNSLQLP